MRVIPRGFDLGDARKKAPRVKGAKRVHVDGYSFPSKRQAKRYEELKLLRRAGQVVRFLMEVSLPLSDPIRDASGKLIDPGERYRIDFIVWWSNGHVSWEDVKGHRTETYVRKKRRAEAMYKITIEEV